MMIFAKFTNAEDSGNSYTFLDEADTDFPVRAPFMNIDMRLDGRLVLDRYRMQRHGAYNTFSYKGGLHMDFGGALFHDTPTDYIIERKSLVHALRGDPDTVPSFRKDGTLELQWEGETESSFIDCVVEATSIPIVANFPTKTDFLITWYAFKPWFTGSDSGDLYYFV